MLSYLKSFCTKAFEWFLRYSHVSAKYKLRLIGMLTCVFLCFNYVLLQIIKAKDFEPLIMELDKSGWLGSFVGNPWFGKGVNLFLGSWNLGPSSETLLGLMLIIFFILVLFVFLSHYIRLFLIPLTLLSTFVFWQVFSILKRNYYVENVVELFDRWGLKLRRNFDPLGLKDEEKIESTINIVYDTFVYVLKAQGKSFQVSGFDRQSLKEEILLRNFESWLSIENFIKERLCSCFKIMEKAQAGGFSFTNSLDGWLPYIVCFVLVAGIVFVTFGLFGATVDYSKSISNVQDAQTKVTEVVEKKVDTVHKSLEKTQDVIGDSLKEVVKPHLEVTQMSLKSSALLQGEVFALQQQAEAQQARIQSLDEQAGLLQELGKSALDASVAAFNKTKMVEGRVDAIATVFSNGSLGELVSYVLELSRSQPMEAERFAYIKKAVDFIINKKV